MISDKLLFLIIVLGAFIALSVKEIIYFIERKDLYDRIMCQSLTEYKRESGKDDKKENKIISGHQKVMSAWRNGERRE